MPGENWVSLATFCKRLLHQNDIFCHVGDPFDLKSRSNLQIILHVKDLLKIHAWCKLGVSYRVMGTDRGGSGPEVRTNACATLRPVKFCCRHFD